MHSDVIKRAEAHAQWLASNGEQGQQGDFAGENLRDIDLRGKNLRQANFERADLERADLEGASLAGQRSGALSGTICCEAIYSLKWRGDV